MLNGALINIINPVNTPDPNTQQPPDTTVTVLSRANGDSNIPWLAASGGAPDVTFWAAPLGDSPPTWFPIAIGAAAIIVLTVPADTMVSPGVIIAGAIPAEIPIHLQVVAANGATRIVAGLTKS